MRQTTLTWVLALTLLPILSALAVQYEARRSSGTVYVEEAQPEHVTLIISTSDPRKAETTFTLARDLYNKGIQTTVLLEGAGVTLVRTPHIRKTGYEGEIAVSPACMMKFGIHREDLPEGASSVLTDFSAGIHAGGGAPPHFQ